MGFSCRHSLGQVLDGDHPKELESVRCEHLPRCYRNMAAIPHCSVSQDFYFGNHLQKGKHPTSTQPTNMETSTTKHHPITA